MDAPGKLESMKDLFEILHIVSGVFIVGPMAVLPMLGLRALRAGAGAQVASLARLTAIVGWLSLLVAVFGFGLMSFEEDLTFTTPWFLTSIILFSVAVTLTLSLVAPLMRRAGVELADAPGQRSKYYGAIAASSGVSALLLVAVVVLMVWRP